MHLNLMPELFTQFLRLLRKLIFILEVCYCKAVFKLQFNPDTLIKNISVLSTSLLLYFFFLYSLTNDEYANMFTFCSISSDKLPAFSKVSRIIPAGHSERKSSQLGRRVGRQIFGTALKVKLSFPVPHRSMETTAGTCTETQLQLQASVHGLQSEVCRQLDWHRVPRRLTHRP